MYRTRLTWGRAENRRTAMIHNTYSVVHVNVSAEFECERVTNSRTNSQSTQYMYT